MLRGKRARVLLVNTKRNRNRDRLESLDKPTWEEGEGEPLLSCSHMQDASTSNNGLRGKTSTSTSSYQSTRSSNGNICQICLLGLSPRHPPSYTAMIDSVSTFQNPNFVPWNHQFRSFWRGQFSAS
jgi:hypothetical protein